MRYFYKKNYSSRAASMSLDGASSPATEFDVASIASSMAAKVLSVSPETQTALFDLDEAQKQAIEAAAGVELFPNYKYSPAVLADDVCLLSAVSTPMAAAGPYKYLFSVEGSDGKKLVDAKVVVKLGPNLFASARSNQNGEASFSLRDVNVLEVRVIPLENYWCTAIPNVQASNATRKLLVEPLELPFNDSLGHFYSKKSKATGSSVKVAIIDSGINDHQDLPEIAVRKTILDGNVTDGCEDNLDNHGTHVAGIVAGKRFGMASGVTLFGYTVFPKDCPFAETMDIATAIDHAVDDGADIINLSLGIDRDDVVITAAIANAIDAGVFVVAATGNDGMSKLLFPARLKDVYAVGAVGLKDAFAPSSTHRLIGARQTNSENEYVAHFSNFAPGKVDGAAPGVAVVSTVCTSGYQAKSGTSMACPVVSGVAARVLAANENVFYMTGRKRVEELKKLLYNGSQTRSLDSQYVGAGLPS